MSKDSKFRDIHKICILRFSSLGDIVMTTAMLRNVRRRFPKAQIDMIVRSDFLDLLDGNPYLDRAIGLPRGDGMGGLFKLLKKMNRERYDLVYDAHRSLRTLFLMPLVSATYKAYYQKHYIRRNLTLALKLPLLRGEKRFLEKFVEPLECFGVKYDQEGPEVFQSLLAKRSALEKVAVPKGKGRLVGLIPSAQWPGKRWPIDRFRALVERIVRESEHRVIVFGGGGDEFCREIVRGLPTDRVVNAQGKLKLGESMALVAECDFVVANDTGLLHVADALGIPAVLFLGPTSRELGCLPFHPLTKVLEHDLWCRPCSKNGQAPCIRGTRVCLERTTVNDAFAALQKLALEVVV